MLFCESARIFFFCLWPLFSTFRDIILDFFHLKAFVLLTPQPIHIVKSNFHGNLCAFSIWFLRPKYTSLKVQNNTFRTCFLEWPVLEHVKWLQNNSNMCCFSEWKSLFINIYLFIIALMFFAVLKNISVLQGLPALGGSCKAWLM